MTNLAQVATAQPLHFNKPFILVTRVGNNETNNEYYNPHQRYYEHDSINELFKHAAKFAGDEKAISCLKIVQDIEAGVLKDFSVNEYGTVTTHYFHDFTAALDEYKRGIRVL